jgi:hypothetical protein
MYCDRLDYLSGVLVISLPIDYHESLGALILPIFAFTSYELNSRGFRWDCGAVHVVVGCCG